MVSGDVCKRMSIGYEEMDIGVTGEEHTSNLHLSNKLETHVMVVDDDSTTLALVSAMLKTWKYQVVAVRNPMDAMSTLRISNTQFGLVVTDLHMPQMTGIEVLRQVEEEFKIPVVIMSSNDEESVMLETLESGAVLYLVKPLTRYDLKNVWQYSVFANNSKGKAVVLEETEGSNNGDQGFSSSSSNEGKSNGGRTDDDCNQKTKKDSNNKGKSKKRRKEDEEDESRPPKKAKVVWTNSLHNRFLQAIRHIGPDRAVPKKILEFMAMPGLTRENVASHLQKYRLFLKRIRKQGTASYNTLTDRTLRSSFATGHPWQMFNNLQQNYPQNNHNLNLQMGTQFQFHPGLGLPPHHSYNHQGNSTSNSFRTTPRRYAQSSPFNNIQSQPLSGNRNPVNHLANNWSVLASNHNTTNGTNFPSGLSNGQIRFNNSTTLSTGLDHGGYGLKNWTSSSTNNVNLSPIQTNKTVSLRIINQIPPTFGNNVGQQQASATEIPTPPQQQYHQLGSNNNGDANLIVKNNNGASSPCENIAQQFGCTGDLSDIFLQPKTSKFQQQEGQRADFKDGSFNAETMNKLLNRFDLSRSFHVDAQNDTWDEQLLGQIPVTNEVVNTNLGANACPLDGYIPILEEHQRGGAHDVDSGDELSRIFQRGHANSRNKQSNDLDIEGDFLDALLAGDVPF